MTLQSLHAKQNICRSPICCVCLFLHREVLNQSLYSILRVGFSEWMDHGSREGKGTCQKLLSGFFPLEEGTQASKQAR